MEKKDIENIDETVTENTEVIPEELKPVMDKVEDDFELLSTYDHNNYFRETKVLNVNGGCIVNTVIKTEEDIAVTSLYIPGNHLRDGQIGQM